jgi:fructose/tagatose bisphosphate aldolase
MEFKSLEELTSSLAPTIRWNGRVEVLRPADLRGSTMDRLVWTAVFAADPQLRDTSRWLIREAALASGAWPASILDLYLARGRGECGGFTVPAFNIRGITYDTVRAAFRAARARDAGAFILELARSEIGYTFQRPGEYAAVVLGAAVREGWTGPVFLQGDHYQVNAKKHAKEPDSEVRAIEALIVEALDAGIFNIDIDTSTLVDLSRRTVPEQQEVNATLAAGFTRHIWKHEPEGVRVSIGGEIGEVGGTNSTAQELAAFMDGYHALAGAPPAGHGRISKISVQTGTSHGGVPLPDGSVAPVTLDFKVLAELGKLSRDRYGMAGAVQHGASTLPDEAFHHFPAAETAEIHLATGFQNMVLDHLLFPEALTEEIHAWVRANCADERKAGQTEEQFLYKARKKAYGPFKRAMWSLPAPVLEGLGRDLEAKFVFYFDKLGVAGTRALVEKTVPRLDVHAPKPRTGAHAEAAEVHAEKDLPASEHAD